MTSANAILRLAIASLLFAGSISFAAGVSAQSTESEIAEPPETVEAENGERDTDNAVDRGKFRLKLLISLVENELQEAALRQSRLTAEASALDQQRRTLQDKVSDGTQSEKKQIEVIERRLQRIDEELAAVNARLPEINTELAELNARLDEANGVVREPEVQTASEDAVVDDASRWLDSKRRVQEALVYLGGYNALIDGDFGPRTQSAIRVYQQRQNLEQTGRLTTEQEAALLEEADVLRTRYGMTTVANAETGYQISYPSGLLKESGDAEPNRRQYLTEDGKGQLVITSSAEGEAIGDSELTALYGDLLSQYEVQYRRKQNGWFVVAGLIEEGRIVYETARLDGDRMVRAQLTYPADWRDIWSPFAVIMFNTFEPLKAGES